MKQIKLFIVDVDGVLTNGSIWYDKSGEEYKAFHIQDGLGLKHLLNNEIEIAVISGRNSISVIRRMKELNVRSVYQGVSDKIEIFTTLLKQLNIAPENVVTMGDDLPDMAIMKASGLSIAPCNAVPKIKSIAHYCTKRSGGEGAVREACDWILSSSLPNFDEKQDTLA